MSESELIAAAEEVADCCQITSGVGAAVGDLRGPVERSAAANNERSDRLIGMNPGRKSHGCCAVEIKSPAGKTKCRAVDHAWRKDMRLADAYHLLAQRYIHEADGVARRGVRLAIITAINSRKCVAGRKYLVETSCAEIFPNVLQGITKGFGNSAWRSRRSQNFGAICHWPECEQGLNTCNSPGARSGVGHQSKVAQTQDLPEAFIVCEKERLVLDDRTATRGAENIALKTRNVTVIEIVPGIECAVTQELVDGAM